MSEYFKAEPVVKVKLFFLNSVNFNSVNFVHL